MFKKLNLTPINTIYICFIIVYTAIREVLPLNFLIDNNFISAAIFGFGAVLIITDLLINRKCINGRAQDLLILFIAVCVISSVINIKYGIFDNLKFIATLMIEYFILFCFAFGDTKEQLTKKLNYTTATLSIVWFIAVFCSVLMYFFNVDIVVFGRGIFGKTSQGFSNEFSRLWGILQDPNYAGATSVVVLFASVRFFARNKNIVLRILNVINIIIQLFYIILGGSRATMILLFLSLAIFIGYRFILEKENICLNDIKKGSLLSVASILICVVIFIGTKTAIPYIRTYAFPENSQLTTKITQIYTKMYSLSGYDFEVNSSVNDKPNSSKDENPNAVNTSVDATATATNLHSLTVNDIRHTGYIVSNKQSVYTDYIMPTTVSKVISLSETTGKSVDDIGRTDLNKADISNGRFKRWTHTLEVFLNAPIFGTSPRNLAAFAKEHNPETLIAKYSSAPHNGYLDVLVETGLVGFCVLAALFIIVMLSVIKSFFKKRYSPTRAFLFVSILTFAGIAVFISDIFMVFSINATLFWLLLGFAYNYDNQHKENGIVYSLYQKILTKIKPNNIAKEE